jgi:hypothetical protein
MSIGHGATCVAAKKDVSMDQDFDESCMVANL